MLHFAVAKADNFDLAFVDVGLPDGEGTDLLRELQLSPQRPIVVIMTSFGSVESAVDCMRAGAFDYLLKPFKPARLHAAVERAKEADAGQYTVRVRGRVGSWSAPVSAQLRVNEPVKMVRDLAGGTVEVVALDLPRTRLALLASDHLPLVADLKIRFD